MPPRTPPSPDPRSTLRAVAGFVCFVLGLSLSLVGFVRLISVLDAGGYGTRAMTTSLIFLGVAGAFLSTGIATLIWDIARRYEKH